MCITLLLTLCKSNIFVAVFRNPWVSKNKIVVTKNTFVAWPCVFSIRNGMT